MMMSKVFGLPAFRPSGLPGSRSPVSKLGGKVRSDQFGHQLAVERPNEFGAIFFILESRGVLSLLSLLALVSADPCLDEAVAPSARQNLVTGS